MNGKIRSAVTVATLSLAAVAGAAVAAQAGASDNHHESNPNIDCRKCGAVDQAKHPSLTTLTGLLNLS
jgi:hypothetical protein